MRRISGSGARRVLTAVTVVVSMLAVMGPAAAAPKVAIHVSVTVTPSTAKVGSVAVVSGAVTSHKTAEALVLQRLVNKHWVTLSHGKTTAGGRYTFNVRAPKKPATWALRVTRTTASPSSSAALHLRIVKTGFAVRASATLRVANGVPVVVTGSVAPKASGSVWLQRLQGKDWHNLVSVKLTKSSTFRLTASLPTGAYEMRVRKAFSTTVADGHSTTLAISVAAPVTPGPTPPTPPAALTVATTTLPPATMGVAYSSSLVASGGAAPYTWGSVGPLSAGISLSGAGVLTGFPTATSSSVITVVVVDANGSSALRTLVLTIGASPAAGRTIRAWGDNSSGALGNSATTSSSSSAPLQVDKLTGVVATAGSTGAGYGLRDDGTVWAWGRNDYDELGDGTVVDEPSPVQVVGVSGVTAIAATNLGGIALRFDGTVWTWGVGVQGQLGNGTKATTSTAVQVSGLTSATAVAGGGATGYAVLADGTVRAWGEGSDGELGDGNGTSSTTPVQVSLLTGVTAVSAGADSGYALRSDGTVWAWGVNGQGQAGDGSLLPRLTPVQVFGLSGVKAIAGNIWNGYALLTNGTVWSWGKNSQGQLGDNTVNSQSSIPVQVYGLSGVTAIAAGALDGYALHPDGTVSAWGDNSSKQLGDDPAAASSNVPVAVLGLSGVISLASGTIAYAAYAVV